MTKRLERYTVCDVRGSDGMRDGKLNPEHVMYIRSMGKALRVTAMFTTDAGANAHMAKTDDAVVAEFAGVIYLANRYDRGVAIVERAES